MKSAADINVALLSGTFTNDDLRSISDAITFVRNRLANSVKRSLKVGVVVSWNSPKKGCPGYGVVKKINTKYVQVQSNDDRRIWNVPASMLEVVVEA